MRWLRNITILLLALGVLCAASAAASSTSSRTGSWRLLPAAPSPFTPDQSAVWTGHKMIVFGRVPANPPWSRDAAAAYAPATGKWQELTPFAGDKGNYEGRYSALWTGRQMLVFGPFDAQSYNPAQNRWRVLSRSLPAEFALGLVVWTGHEAIAWGGGCCADASADGWAYNPATGKLRKLAHSPLAPSSGPTGAWTGRRLIVFVDGINPDNGKPYPASFARAATYTPTTNTWRRIAPMPAQLRGGTVVWNGHELLVAGAGKTARSAYAYDPAGNRWRMLAPLPAPRLVGVGTWAGTRLLLVGGHHRNQSASLRDGLAYVTQTNRWMQLPAMPFRADRFGTVSVWTGRELIVTSRGRAAAYTP